MFLLYALLNKDQVLPGKKNVEYKPVFFLCKFLITVVHCLQMVVTTGDASTAVSRSINHHALSGHKGRRIRDESICGYCLFFPCALLSPHIHLSYSELTEQKLSYSVPTDLATKV
jgi:hypothetical protein